MSTVRHSSHEEDGDLVRAWRRGDATAFEALVRKHQKRLLNISFRITGNFEDACSIVQQTFALAYRGNDTLRGALPFSTWLAAIVVRLSRENTGRPQTPPAVEAGSVPAGSEDAAADSLPPHKHPERHDPERHLQECLELLPLELREVLVLRDVQEFSYDEICSILKVRHDAVASRLSRARETLKSCLSDKVGGV